MKKFIILLVSFVGIVIGMSSCTVSKSVSAKTMDITRTGVYQNTVLVDLKVSETKVTGKAMGKITAGAQVNQQAVAAALKAAGADVLVEPVYSTETSGSTITVTVVGFPATYINFRPLKAKDLKLINAYKSVSLKTTPSQK